MNFKLTGHNQREIHIEPLINESQIELAIKAQIDAEDAEFVKACRPRLVQLMMRETYEDEARPVRRPSRARRSGVLRGQIRISDDFDSPLPKNIAESFGVTNE